MRWTQQPEQSRFEARSRQLPPGLPNSFRGPRTWTLFYCLAKPQQRCNGSGAPAFSGVLEDSWIPQQMAFGRSRHCGVAYKATSAVPASHTGTASSPSYSSSDASMWSQKPEDGPRSFVSLPMQETLARLLAPDPWLLSLDPLSSVPCSQLQSTPADSRPTTLSLTLSLSQCKT